MSNAKPHFTEHPNWCAMGDAVDRLDAMLDQLESREITQDEASAVSLREPFVVTGRVNLQLSELIESDLLNALHKHPKSGAAVAMVADEDDRILESLCEAVIMLFPVEPDRRHEPELPFSWVPALRRSIAESHVQAGLQRYLLIDQFHLILSAPEKDQRAFGRVLRQLAALETVTVIAGVNESGMQEAAELLGFVEVEKDEPSALMRHHVRPEVELVKLNTLGYRRKRRATETGVALAGCITGAALMAIFGGKIDRRPTFAMVDSSTRPQTALIETINPQGQAKRAPDFVLPKTFSDELVHSSSTTIAETGPDPELPLVEEFKSTPNLSKSDMLYFVAEAYCFGHGVETDLTRGLNYLNQAYNFGNEKAANLLGTCYSKGLGVEKNVDRAFELYEEAVNRGSVYAFGNIGVHYLRGWGCDSDADKANAMFVRGAERGDPVAALYLAKCLEAGIGNQGKPDPTEAQRWYVEAAKKGNEGALLWCRENGVKVQS